MRNGLIGKFGEDPLCFREGAKERQNHQGNHSNRSSWLAGLNRIHYRGRVQSFGLDFD